MTSARHNEYDDAPPAGDVPFKQAVQTAKAQVAEVFEVPREELLLEELDFRPDVWLVTLSMPSRLAAKRANAVMGSAWADQLLASGFAGEREFKLVEVRRDTGEVASIRVRSLLPS